MDDSSIFLSGRNMNHDKKTTAIDLAGVGQRVKAVRVSSGMIARDFAHTVDIDASSYSKIEAGKKALNADMGFRIAQTWGVTMDFLYRGRLTDTPEKVVLSLRKIENATD